MALGVQAVTIGFLRVCAAAGLTCAVAGCANSSSDAFRVGKLLIQQLTGHGQMITREQAAGIPYASIGVQLGPSGQGLAVLGKGIGEDRYWYSGNSILFVTRAGRVVQTVGLPYDLSHVDVRSAGASGQRSSPGTAAHFALVYDFQDLGAFNIVATCDDTDEGPETITILETNIETRHHIEHCKAPELDWSFENEFWLDAKTGYVWQSVQNIHPRSSLLTVVVFRPESSPRPQSGP
jgi:hypothetical protein